MGLGRTVFRLLFAGAISALLVALAARFLDPILGLRPREGQATYRNIDSTQESEGADGSDLIEPDRTVLPGISVRS
jgi:hypothetical protein